MATLYRVGGPPGTGKTTWLAHRIADAAAARGDDKVLVTSFTKAAAVELVRRNLAIPRENVGTLHALCYHALERPTIAETKIDEWNERVRATHPAFMLTAKADERKLDDPLADPVSSESGDALMAQLQLLRNALTPRSAWPPDVLAFDAEWRAWKEETCYEDFTGMLERALDFYGAPGHPEVIFLDEAQDCVPLQWAVLRRWAEEADTFIVAGDDDQLIYSHLGAAPDLFLDPPLPTDQERVLHLSYRVPRTVLEWSQCWISKVTRRWSKEYYPRTENKQADGPVIDGAVQRADCLWRVGDTVLPVIDAALSRNNSIMILASCSYMLEPILHSLRSHGYPFHNPYRKSNGAWNPLGAGRGLSSRDRLLTFLRPDPAVWGEQARWWTWSDVTAWADMLKVAGIFKKGGRGRLDAIAEEIPDMPADIDRLLAEVFEEEALDRAFERDIDWLKSHLLAARERGLTFPLRILEQRGGMALREDPRLIIGTIHSVKGGEADEVLLFPDLSPQGMMQWLPVGLGRDAVRRMFYVGATRCRSILHLAEPSAGNLAVGWEE